MLGKLKGLRLVPENSHWIQRRVRTFCAAGTVPCVAAMLVLLRGASATAEESTHKVLEASRIWPPAVRRPQALDGSDASSTAMKFAELSVSAELDGVPLQASLAFALISGGLGITLLDITALMVHTPPAVISLVLVFTPPLDVGTFNLGPQSVGSIVENHAGEVVGWSTDLQHSGTATLSMVNPPLITGTFSFDAYNGDSGTTRHVRNGMFQDLVVPIREQTWGQVKELYLR